MPSSGSKALPHATPEPSLHPLFPGSPAVRSLSVLNHGSFLLAGVLYLLPPGILLREFKPRVKAASGSSFGMAMPRAREASRLHDYGLRSCGPRDQRRKALLERTQKVNRGRRSRYLLGLRQTSKLIRTFDL